MLLSSRGLRNVVCDDSAFEFKVNGREFVLSKFKAQFISPAVSRSLRFDPTQSSFAIDIPDSIDNFETILSICEGNSISVEPSRVYGFGAVCQALENDELIEIAMGGDRVSISNVGLRLSLSTVESDVEFACEHFLSLDHSSLPMKVLELLLGDKRLKIESEDWLLNIIESRVSRDDSLIGLLDYVKCEYLSVEGMSKFFSLISIESMSSSVWSSLWNRLQMPISLSNENPRAGGHAIPLDRSRPFDGVFACLSRQCGENPHNTGLIAISANDDLAYYKCHELISAGKSWTSNNNAVDHYVKVDLKNLRLVPSGYSVKTHNSEWGDGRFVRSWRFEGSNDDSTWEVLDSHTNSDELMGNDKEVSFAISTTTQFRFLRFIQTGLNSSGYHSLRLQRWEIFGFWMTIRS
jgi:hypothetical protein